jgi:hydroxypyruvate reductase
MTPRQLLLGSFRAALAAADPLVIVPRHLPPPTGRTLVVGAGKAAASMAKAVENAWPAGASLDGVVITRYAHGYSGDEALKRIRVVEAGHPVPDQSGEAAAQEILARASALGADDLLLVLVSGGGSSLLSLPAEGISMADLKTVTRELLACGAPIQEMNVVRKHLSRIQGGRLAAATRAQVVALIISDVAGDDPSAIASGPTVADPSTYQDALDILNAYRITPPVAIARHLSNGARGGVPETLKAGDPVFVRVQNHMIATAHASLSLAGAYFQQHGVSPLILGDTVTGEAREVAKVYAALARQIRQHQHPMKPPVALISGGECTVTIREGAAATGRGGRCSEFLLALAIEMEGVKGVSALACDTDGIDGSEDNAGAHLGEDSLARAKALGLEPKRLLANNDAYGFFAPLEDLVVTGPTRTNVNDYRVILIT